MVSGVGHAADYVLAPLSYELPRENPPDVGVRTYNSYVTHTPDPEAAPFAVHTLDQLARAGDARILIRGSIVSLQLKRNKLGDLWASFVLGTSEFDMICLVFARTYQAHTDVLGTKGLRVEVQGRAHQRDDGEYRLMVGSIRRSP